MLWIDGRSGSVTLVRMTSVCRLSLWIDGRSGSVTLAFFCERGFNRYGLTAGLDQLHYESRKVFINKALRDFQIRIIRVEREFFL